MHNLEEFFLATVLFCQIEACVRLLRRGLIILKTVMKSAFAALAAIASAIAPISTGAQEDNRCADLATLVETVAEARDEGMPKREYKQGFNLGLNSTMSGSQLNYGQREGKRERMDAY